MSSDTGKQILLEFLAFLQFKVENDLLTMEEIQSFINTLDANITVLGTIDDFAAFYNQSRTNISSVIHRRMIEKPVRKVYYSFKAFRKIVPERWHKINEHRKKNQMIIPDKEKSELGMRNQK